MHPKYTNVPNIIQCARYATNNTSHLSKQTKKQKIAYSTSMTSAHSRIIPQRPRRTHQLMRITLLYTPRIHLNASICFRSISSIQLLYFCLSNPNMLHEKLHPHCTFTSMSIDEIISSWNTVSLRQAAPALFYSQPSKPSIYFFITRVLLAASMEWRGTTRHSTLDLA